MSDYFNIFESIVKSSNHPMAPFIGKNKNISVGDTVKFTDAIKKLDRGYEFINRRFKVMTEVNEYGDVEIYNKSAGTIETASLKLEKVL